MRCYIGDTESVDIIDDSCRAPFCDCHFANRFIGANKLCNYRNCWMLWIYMGPLGWYPWGCLEYIDREYIFIIHGQYQGSWWPGDRSRQDISSRDIDTVLIRHSGYSTYSDIARHGSRMDVPFSSHLFMYTKTCDLSSKCQVTCFVHCNLSRVLISRSGAMMISKGNLTDYIPLYYH